jgi:phosphoribosylglycinamide formyltransferase-1
VLLSGGGSTMQNLADRIRLGELHARIVVVISSNAKAYGLERAAKLKIPNFVVPRKGHDAPAEFSDLVFDLVRDADADLVVLAGWMSLLAIPDDFRGRVVNIHPALLPAFGGEGMYGHHVHEAVLAHGCKITGCTVHFADAAYDTGPIILQRTCEVLEIDTPDTLAARVQMVERLAYPQAIELIAQGRVRLDASHGRRVRIEPSTGARADAEAMLDRALWLAVEAHRGQYRRPQGSPYVEHPLAVAQLLRQHGVGEPAIIAAAFLHDVVEDTSVTLADIRREFGDAVASLVDHLTLPPDPDRSFQAKHAALAQHARRMPDAAKLIKLADRLHNLSELHHRPVEKQRAYAGKALELLEALEPIPPRGQALADAIRQLAQRFMASDPST